MVLRSVFVAEQGWLAGAARIINCDSLINCGGTLEIVFGVPDS